MYVTNKKEWFGVDIVKIFTKACYEAVLCLVAAFQIDESGPNKPNIIYIQLFGEKFKTKMNETESILHECISLGTLFLRDFDF